MDESAPEGVIDPLVLRRVTARVDAAAAAVVQRHDLDLEQWRMLQAVCATAATMSTLTDVLALTGPTATRTADRLVTSALAYRDVDTTDRRRVVLRASQRGRALCRRLAAEVGEAQDQALAALSPEQRRRLTGLMRRALTPHAAPHPAGEPS